MTNEFVTRDLYFGAFLYAKGAKFKGVNREGRTCWFIFANEVGCKTLQLQFFSKTAEVNAKEFVDAIQTFKDLIFAENRRN